MLSLRCRSYAVRHAQVEHGILIQPKHLTAWGRRGRVLRASAADGKPVGTPAPVPVPAAPVPAPQPITTGAPALSIAGNSTKAVLLDSVLGTDRGLSARSEVRAEINELINQVEGMATSEDTVKLIDGYWDLIYTNSTDVLAILALGNLPLSPMKIGAVTQHIDAATLTVENKIQLLLPGIKTSLATVATYEVASPKRLQYHVTKGVLQTPELLSNIELPSTISVLGQTIDVSMAKELLQPMARGAQGLAASLTDLLQQTPSPTVDMPVQNTSWQLNTYVDQDLRITRGDGGAVFVFKRAAPPPPPATVAQPQP